MSAFATFVLVATVALDPGATLLDLDVERGRALVGLATPAPENADPLLVMRVHLVDGGERVAWPLGQQLLQHARLLPEGGFVASLPNGTLVEVAADGGIPERLDTGLIGAIAVSEGGRFLAYTKGQIPDLEVWRYDREFRQPAPVTVDMAPTWSPGISRDGQTVFFASGRSGVPALWRVDGSEEPRQLTNIGADAMGALQPTPAGVTATVVSETRVVFPSRVGTQSVDWEGRP